MAKEILIFLFLFLVILGGLLIIFNGRFFYAQLKYAFIGPRALEQYLTPNQNPENQETKEEKNYIPTRLIIPVLGIDAPIIWPLSKEENDLQKALESGVVLWPESSYLGKEGTIIILGHSSAYPWYRGAYGSVFSLLDKLQVGDEVYVYSADRIFTYRVVGKKIDFPENLKIEESKGEAVLYLLSCWPVRTNWKRIAIKAISLDRI